MDDKWIDNIRDKMADYDVAAPAGLLDAVEAKIRARRMRRKRILGAIAASVALIGGISVALIPDLPETASSPLVSNETGKKKGDGIKEEFINHIAEAAIDSGPVSIMPKSKGVVVAKNTPVENSENAVLIETEYAQDETEGYVEQSQAESETHAPADKFDYDRNSEYLSAVEPIGSRSDIHAPVSVGVYASANGLGGILGDDGIDGRQLLASTPIPHTRMGGGMLNSPNIDDSPAPRFIEVFDHKLPLRVSVDLSWPIGYNLNIGTGLTYSYLRSDIRYGYSDSPLFKASQELHFLGIPVNVRYIPWSFKKLDIYASAGLMAEKCLGGGIKKEDHSDPGYSYAGCNDRPFQFSFNAAVGLQYSLAGSCAVFIEPGIGLYLKNGSRLRTIYSERPLTFSVNVGFRFGR